jgi:hypothetical protein
MSLVKCKKCGKVVATVEHVKDKKNFVCVTCQSNKPRNTQDFTLIQKGCGKIISENYTVLSGFEVEGSRRKKMCNRKHLCNDCKSRLEGYKLAFQSELEKWEIFRARYYLVGNAMRYVDKIIDDIKKVLR